MSKTIPSKTLALLLLILPILCLTIVPGTTQQANPVPAKDDMVAVGDTGYSIDRHEVTNARFAAFLNARGNQKQDGVPWIALDSKYALIAQTDRLFMPKPGFEDHPAIEVSWQAAKAYCQWAGKRLPSEEEWFVACAGPQGTRFPWGETFEPGRANISGAKDGFLRTAPVGSFPPGATSDGALDMGGNVWEWTAAAQIDSAHLRGGSWINGKSLARCASRTSVAASHSYVRGNTVGFRCVR